MERLFGAIVMAVLIFFSKEIWDTPKVLGESAIQEILPVSQPITTQSRFTEQLTDEVEVIPKKTIFQDDPETEAGEEKILSEGNDGKKVKIVKTYFYDEEFYDKEIVSTEIIEPKDKKILRGTKIVWKTLNTTEGEIRYWKKIRVYTTHYDSRCPGCNEWTAIGMRAGKGVIAVDPKVIPMRSKVYVPWYGLAIAGDTGGAIKGNIIDLGFDDAKTAGWSTRFVNIYLL